MGYTNKEGKPRGQASQRKGYTMTKFIITSNGQPVADVPTFWTYNSAVLYIGMADMNNEWQVAEQADESDSSVGAQFIKTQNKLNEVLAELENERKERAIDQANIKRYLSIIEDKNTKFNGVRDYIQSSIDRDEWTSTELEEIFWEELADRLDLDLKQTEEKELKFTVTYSATITVPKNADLDDLDLQVGSYPDIYLNGVNVGEARWEETEASEY